MRAEFGLTAAKGLSHIEPLLARIENDQALPELAKELFATLRQDYARLKLQIREIHAKLAAWHRNNELSQRLAEVPTVGPIGACLLAIKVTDPHAFRSGRDFAAWIGLTPKDHSTAGKQRLGAITRAGDEALRQGAGRRRHGRGPAGPQGQRPSVRLAGRYRQTQAAQTRRRGPRQQERSRLVEVDGQRRTLQSPSGARPLRSPDRQCSVALASSRPLRAAFGGGP